MKKNKAIESVNDLIEKFKELEHNSNLNNIFGEEYTLLYSSAEMLIKNTFSKDRMEEFNIKLSYGGYYGDDNKEEYLAYIEHLKLCIIQLKVIKQEMDNYLDDDETDAPQNKIHNNVKYNKTFIVHGHDNEMLQTSARFIELFGIEVIILLEQEGRGKTIIEKLEKHSEVPFSIVLLTSDDVGKSIKDNELNPRARQNVIFELGFFVGKLGRNNVAVLYQEGVELPSDYTGVEYIKIDKEGYWKMRLAREMKAAGFVIDLNKVK
jgi:predicted nucleotide-binding protein